MILWQNMIVDQCDEVLRLSILQIKSSKGQKCKDDEECQMKSNKGQKCKDDEECQTKSSKGQKYKDDEECQVMQ
eukprot:8999407-Ditylum_brightwellii.AAC.1